MQVLWLNSFFRKVFSVHPCWKRKITCCAMMSMVIKKSVMYIQLINWGCLTRPIDLKMDRSSPLQGQKQTYTIHLCIIWTLVQHLFSNAWTISTNLLFQLLLLLLLSSHSLSLHYNCYRLTLNNEDCELRHTQSSETVSSPSHVPRSSIPPAAVPVCWYISVKGVPVGYEERPPGAEDDCVVRCRGQRQEEHFELKADSQEDSTCNEW